MEITRATLDKVAHLARLEFEGEQADQMMTDMTRIVAWVDKLREVDTTGVEPLTSMSQEVNAFREDNPLTSLSREDMLKRAPRHDDRHFRVPRVID